MWIFIAKHSSRLGNQIIRQVSNFADDLGESLLEGSKHFLKNDQENKSSTRSLRIGILGLPNAGKSTLINHLIGRPVCAASSKVHTTRRKAAGIYCENNIQLIFIDTPGLISVPVLKKFSLEKSLLVDPKTALEDVDVVGIIQDMSNALARRAISDRILEVIKDRPSSANAILILNKVDKIKNKKVLLEIVKKLTKKNNYPKFSEVFMVSALTGDGVNHLRNYFLDCAKQRRWDYSQESFTDQPVHVVVQNIIRAKLLDNLPQELPYQIEVCAMEVTNCIDGSINAIATANCTSERLARLVIGKKGDLIKKIAKEAEEDISAVFRTTVRLKVIIPINDSRKEKAQGNQVN